MFTEICALIRASQQGDAPKAAAYARLLSTNLRKEGKATEADRILRALGDLPPSENVAALDNARQPSCYFVNYWVLGEIVARKHDLGETSHLQAGRMAHAYEDRGCCVELWEQKGDSKPVCVYETKDEN